MKYFIFSFLQTRRQIGLDQDSACRVVLLGLQPQKKRFVTLTAQGEGSRVAGTHEVGRHKAGISSGAFWKQFQNAKSAVCWKHRALLTFSERQ